MKTEVVCEETKEYFQEIKVEVLPCTKDELERQQFNIRLQYEHVYQGQRCLYFADCIFDSEKYWEGENSITLTAVSENANKIAALYLANWLADIGDIFEAISKRYDEIRLSRLQDFVLANPEYMHLMKIEYIPESYNNGLKKYANMIMQKRNHAQES